MIKMADIPSGEIVAVIKGMTEEDLYGSSVNKKINWNRILTQSVSIVGGGRKNEEDVI